MQIIVWLISADFIIKIASSTFGSVIGSLHVSPDFLILGVVYFILGYLLMAVLMAAVGSVSATAREGQQMSAFFIIPVLIPVYFMALIMEHPENIVVKILTFIPFTAPITVIVRLGLSQIPGLGTGDQYSDSDFDHLGMLCAGDQALPDLFIDVRKEAGFEGHCPELPRVINDV